MKDILREHGEALTSVDVVRVLRLSSAIWCGARLVSGAGSSGWLSWLGSWLAGREGAACLSSAVDPTRTGVTAQAANPAVNKSWENFDNKIQTILKVFSYFSPLYISESNILSC